MGRKEITATDWSLPFFAVYIEKLLLFQFPFSCKQYIVTRQLLVAHVSDVFINGPLIFQMQNMSITY